MEFLKNVTITVPLKYVFAVDHSITWLIGKYN